MTCALFLRLVEQRSAMQQRDVVAGATLEATNGSATVLRFTRPWILDGVDEVRIALTPSHMDCNLQVRRFPGPMQPTSCSATVEMGSSKSPRTPLRASPLCS